MIMGLDSDGHVYLSLLQSNNNTKTMDLFFKSLCRKLDQERPAWRKDTVILLDNVSSHLITLDTFIVQAPYHKSAGFFKMLEGLRIPVLFTGPHSYDACPCELWFAHFKKADVNPRKVKTGKG